MAADVAVAVHYPRTFSQDLTEGQIKQRLRRSKLPVRVVVPEDISGRLFRPAFGAIGEEISPLVIGRAYHFSFHRSERCMN